MLGGLTLSGVETLLFPSQLSLTRFYYANEVINTVNHTKRLTRLRS